jgi:hypothetical protein
MKGGAMTTHVTATFTIEGWDEKTYAELEDGGKLSLDYEIG